MTPCTGLTPPQPGTVSCVTSASPSARPPTTLRPRSTSFGITLLPSRVLLVLEADEFHEIGVRQQRRGQRVAPWLRVGLRIVNRRSDLQMSIVLSRELRRHVQRFRRRLAQLIEPHAAVEPAAVDDE